MITLSQVNLIDQSGVDITVPSDQNITVDASGLLALPGLLDPHVHFRTPGEEHKENWETASAAAIHGGYTHVFDMPNNKPACISLDRLHAKKEHIDQQLVNAGIPLRYGLYIGADKNHFHEIGRVKNDVVGIKVFMGSSTGDLLMDDDSSLHAIFSLAASHDLLLAIHSENECMIQENMQRYAHETAFSTHSKVRSPEVAEAAVRQVIELARCYGTRVYILHVSTRNELDLIRQAKKEGVCVYAEACPHHLFLTTEDYALLGAKAQMNPALRDPVHQEALWHAVLDGTIDTVGSDHAPHTLIEKNQPYGKVPSGVPGIETTLPLLLTAYHEGRISLERIVELTGQRAREMFQLPKGHDDWVLVDLEKEKTVVDAALKTRCQWSPFHGRTLKGWPVKTILAGKVFDV